MPADSPARADCHLPCAPCRADIPSRSMMGRVFAPSRSTCGAPPVRAAIFRLRFLAELTRMNHLSVADQPRSTGSRRGANRAGHHWARHAAGLRGFDWLGHLGRASTAARRTCRPHRGLGWLGRIPRRGRRRGGFKCIDFALRGRVADWCFVAQLPHRRCRSVAG